MLAAGTLLFSGRSLAVNACVANGRRLDSRAWVVGEPRSRDLMTKSRWSRSKAIQPVLLVVPALDRALRRALKKALSESVMPEGWVVFGRKSVHLAEKRKKREKAVSTLLVYLGSAYLARSGTPCGAHPAPDLLLRPVNVSYVRGSVSRLVRCDLRRPRVAAALVRHGSRSQLSVPRRRHDARCTGRGIGLGIGLEHRSRHRSRA